MSLVKQLQMFNYCINDVAYVPEIWIPKIRRFGYRWRLYKASCKGTELGLTMSAMELSKCRRIKVGAYLAALTRSTTTNLRPLQLFTLHK